VKKAFYQQAKQYHPDTNKVHIYLYYGPCTALETCSDMGAMHAMHAQDNVDAAKKFQEVQKAYETLRDPEKRRIYDQVTRGRLAGMRCTPLVSH
jgi:curved DNA-binding protein CbpA